MQINFRKNHQHDKIETAVVYKCTPVFLFKVYN